jgi:hypothetical protein
MRLLLIRHGQSRSLLQSSDDEVLPDDINILTTKDELLVHQVNDWGSGVAIKMGRRQGGPSRTGDRKEHIWTDT